jgi:hypothetical protein
VTVTTWPGSWPERHSGPDLPLRVVGTVHDRRVEALVSGLSDVLAQIARWTRDDPDAIGSWGLRDDYSEPLMIPVRRKAGSAGEGGLDRIGADGSARGESGRVAHVVRLIPGEPHGGMVTAVCGERLPLLGIDALRLGVGMPCERCLAELMLGGATVSSALDAGTRSVLGVIHR